MQVREQERERKKERETEVAGEVRGRMEGVREMRGTDATDKRGKKLPREEVK